MKNVINIRVSSSEVKKIDWYLRRHALSQALSEALVKLETCIVQVIKWRVDGKDISLNDPTPERKAVTLTREGRKALDRMSATTLIPMNTLIRLAIKSFVEEKGEYCDDEAST